MRDNVEHVETCVFFGSFCIVFCGILLKGTAMDERDSSPQTTLVILLGASQWPEFPDFHGSQAFVHVAVDFSRYLLDQEQFGLPRENFLNLFDTDLSPDKIDLAMRYFLDRRTAELKQAGHGPTDLLFYFVGHGGFVGKNSEYYLAVRCTSSANPAVSGIRMEPLAATLTERARYLRRLIILDCCYSAAAFSAFQAEGPTQVAIRQTVEVFKGQAKKVGKGTALLCSSGKKILSAVTAEEDRTLFSRALLHVLATSGNPYRPDEAYLSLREVADLTEEVLGSLLEEKAPRPELHSPDQVDGDVAKVPFFPNPIVKAAKGAQSNVLRSRQEQSVGKPPSPRSQDRPSRSGDEISEYVTARLPHLSPKSVSTSGPRNELKPMRRVKIITLRQGLSSDRIALLVGLALLVIAGSTGFFYLLTTNQRSVGDANATATTRTIVAATATSQSHKMATTTAQVVATATKPEQMYARLTSGTPVLDDPLIDNSKGYNWYEGTDSIGTCVFTGGAYHNIEPKPGYHTCGPPGASFRDFAFQVQMVIVKGDAGGIIFRWVSTHAYGFYISQEGSYELLIDFTIIKYGSSSAIKVGLNQSNLIAVLAHGNTIDLFVNEQYITSVNDSTYSEGIIGVGAHDISNPTEVEFRNAKAWTF